MKEKFAAGELVLCMNLRLARSVDIAREPYRVVLDCASCFKVGRSVPPEPLSATMSSQFRDRAGVLAQEQVSGCVAPNAMAVDFRRTAAPYHLAVG